MRASTFLSHCAVLAVSVAVVLSSEAQSPLRTAGVVENEENAALPYRSVSAFPRAGDACDASREFPIDAGPVDSPDAVRLQGVRKLKRVLLAEIHVNDPRGTADSDIEQANDALIPPPPSRGPRSGPNLRYYNAPENGAFLVEPWDDVCWGDPITVHYAIANFGDVDITERFYTRFFLSTNDYISDSDESWHTVYRDSLSGGYYYYNSRTWDLPSSPPDGFPDNGRIYVGMWIDYYDDITETDESDNRNQGIGDDVDWLDVIQCALADLTVPYISVSPNPVTEGVGASITATVRNDGSATAPSSDVRIVLSTDSNYGDGDDWQVCIAYVPSLDVGDETDVTCDFDFPDLEGGGDYEVRVYVEVDYYDDVEESNESNVYYRTGWWTVYNPPTLVGSGCYVSPSTAFAGNTVTFYYGVYNPNSSSIQVGLGASIRPPGGSWIDDVSCDTYVSVSSGTHDYSRCFHIPTYATYGYYDTGWGLHANFDTGPMWDYLERSDDLLVCGPLADIMDMAIDPPSGSTAPAGQSLDLDVEVWGTFPEGVLQVMIYGHGADDEDWDYIPGQSGSWTFDLDIYESTAGSWTYTIMVQFRPGATSGPIQDCGPCDTIEYHDYTIDWYETTSFNGQVTHCVTGTSLADAQVEWGPYSTTTDWLGDYSFENLPCGTHALTVSKGGYTTHSESYTPECGTTNTKNVCLCPTASTVHWIDPDPDSGSSALMGQSLDVTVDVMAEITTAGVLQVMITGHGADTVDWEVFTDGYSGITSFDLQLTSSGPGERTYTIWVQFRPGATGGPIEDSGPCDTMESVDYTIEWQQCPPQSTILALNVEPESGTTADVGEWLDLDLDVFAEIAYPGVLQVAITDHGADDVDWTYIDVSQSGCWSFDLDVLESSPGVRTYALHVQFRPGATSGPLDTTDECDTVATYDYTVDWRSPATSFGGWVTDCDMGTALAGATVQWGGDVRTANAQGYYFFDAMPCETRTLTVGLADYETHTESYTPACQTTNLKNVCLSPHTASLEGWVTNCDGGSAIEGAVVSWGGFSTTTGPDGYYLLNGLPCETRTLTISADGYETYYATVTPPCDTTGQHDACLTPHGLLISDIIVNQRSEAGQLVDIYYNLTSPTGPCTITLAMSNDGGATWDVPTDSAIGDIDAGIAPGGARHIVWDPIADAPGQQGCDFKVELSADDGQGSSGSWQSSTFCVQTPDGYENEVRIGQLVFTAETITQISDQSWQLQGNVELNGRIHLTGTVTADTGTLMANGDGQVTIDAGALGDVVVYDGEWEFDGQSAATTAINEALSGLKVVGLDVEVSRLTVIPDGIRIQGRLVMPELLNGARLEIADENYLQLTSAGLEFSGAVLEIEDIDGMALIGLPFHATSVVLHVSASEVEIRGILELPALLGGTTIDLSTDNNHIRITEVAGEAYVEIIGNLAMAGPIVLGPGFSLENMLFLLNTEEDILQADGTLNVPAGFGIAAGVGFRGGYFNYVHAGAVDMGIVVITGPPPAMVPIVYWQDVEGWVNELAPGPPPVILGGSMAFTAGPQIDDYYLARLQLEAEYDTGGRFTGLGQVLLGGGDEPFEFASALIILDNEYGMYVNGHMSYIGIVDMDGALRIDLYNNMQGNLVGTIHVPDWLGGMDLAETTLYGQYYDDVDLTNDYFIAAVTMIFGFETAVSFDINTGELDWNADMDLIHEIDVPPPGKGRDGLGPPYAFDLPAGLSGTLFKLAWSSGDTDLHLSRPDGTLITPDSVDDHPDVRYFKDTVGLQAIFSVVEPEAGAWTLDVTNAGDIGGYEVQHLNTTSRPVIALIEPSSDVTGGSVEVTWTDADMDSGAEVGLYYDNDREGADGDVIATGIPADDPADSYTWDTTGVPSGVYYVYAKIDNGENAPVIDYSVGRAIVIDPDAPAVSTDIAAGPGENVGELVLSWIAGRVVEHFLIGLTSDPAGEFYDVRIAGDDETETTLTGLVPGQQYRLAVATVDAAGHVSPFSAPIVVTVTDPANHAPVFVGGIATRATVGQLYESQVLSTDLDDETVFHDLAGEPDGMTISPDGLIQWTPAADQVYSHSFAVLLDDGVGGTNEHMFTVRVAPPDVFNRPPEILSQAPANGEPGATVSYQVLAVDPDAGDTLWYDLLVGPGDAAVDAVGLVTATLPAESGRHEFLVRVTDDVGLYDLQRFTVQTDIDAPTLEPAAWGELNSPAPDALEVTAAAVPDATGLVEYQLELDGQAEPWQTRPAWSFSALAPNTAHDCRVTVRDAAPGMNESSWSDVITRYTLADVPPAPTLVTAEETALVVSLSPGTNPADTELALWNVSRNEWIALDGSSSPTPVWADAGTWGDARVEGLSPNTTYRLSVKARNEDGIQTAPAATLSTKTLVPAASAELTPTQTWLYENSPGSTEWQVTVTASFVDDPFDNSIYTYTWIAPENPETGKMLILVDGGGGANDDFAVFAAPEAPSAAETPYEIRCIITGVEAGNYVAGTVEISVIEDTQPPEVVSSTPTDGTIHYKDCPVDTVVVAFSEEVRGPGGDSLGIGDFEVDGSSDSIITLEYDSDTHVATLAVLELTDVAWHVVRVSGAIEDLAGNQLVGNTTGGVPGSNHHWIDIGILHADFQQDGDVDVFDRTQFLAAWTDQQGSSGDDLTADYQCDGDVDVFDRTQFLATWTDNFGLSIGSPPEH